MTSRRRGKRAGALMQIADRLYIDGLEAIGEYVGIEPEDAFHSANAVLKVVLEKHLHAVCLSWHKDRDKSGLQSEHPTLVISYGPQLSIPLPYKFIELWGLTKKVNDKMNPSDRYQDIPEIRDATSAFQKALEERAIHVFGTIEYEAAQAVVNNAHAVLEVRKRAYSHEMWMRDLWGKYTPLIEAMYPGLLGKFPKSSIGPNVPEFYAFLKNAAGPVMYFTHSWASSPDEILLDLATSDKFNSRCMGEEKIIAQMIVEGKTTHDDGFWFHQHWMGHLFTIHGKWAKSI